MLSRWERLGLQARITFLLALGGLFLSTTIAITTLTLTRQNLLDERSEVAFAAFTANGQRVQRQLGDIEEPDVGTVEAIFAGLTLTTGAEPLLRFEDQWVAGGTVFNAETVPLTLTAAVDEGNAARMRARIDGSPAVISGVRLPGRNAAYYEALLIDDVEDTLDALAIIVLGVAAAATLLAAGIGAWASRRTLRPVAQVRAAAESLAAGELDTRLDPPADADLASLAASFNEMARSLEYRIERDARFASEVSHELRSPLMTLNASIEVLNNDRERLSARSQTALGLLNDDVARFTQLVEDLLEISRFDVGTAALRAEPILLAEFIRQAVQHSTRPDIAVDAQTTAEHTVIMGDKRRLAQVVANLVDNADKYGGGEIEISISQSDEAVLIAVEDHGPGVPEAERAVIFDRFSRGSSGGRRGYDTGSGLGLSLVAEHVGLHGGEVWVEDRLDGERGSRFVVSLPIGEVSEEDIEP